MNNLARLLVEVLRKRIAPLGIVPGQFPTLLALWEKDGLTQKELLVLVDIEQATLANTLTRMERDGLITRKEHPADARARTIHLTNQGRSIRDEAYKAAAQINEEVLADLSDAETEAFLSYMRRVIGRIKEVEATS
ncbi:MarR family transcriptional regulator [Pacificoceanicola onchidii]|uniref:MarR family winged helix-turn-helix transcriptional regulator n=1 Tax=Pacificoceanicola onchidii TaxID=2562685 RepID=UPI0030B8D44E